MNNFATDLINLGWRLTNLKVGIDLADNYGDSKAFVYYSKDFMFITEKEIDEIFECFIKCLRKEIWRIISSEQKRIKTTDIETYCKYGVGEELHNFSVMIHRLIRSLI